MIELRFFTRLHDFQFLLNQGYFTVVAIARSLTTSRTRTAISHPASFLATMALHMTNYCLRNINCTGLQ